MCSCSFVVTLSRPLTLFLLLDWTRALYFKLKSHMLWNRWYYTHHICVTVVNEVDDDNRLSYYLLYFKNVSYAEIDYA